MDKEMRYMTYEEQVEHARWYGVSVTWLRKLLRDFAHNGGFEIIFQHKPRAK